jgi:signal transduction histidine kinase
VPATGSRRWRPAPVTGSRRWRPGPATGSRRWRPRWTIRLRLTLLYGLLFLIAGATLLAITYGLVAGGGAPVTARSFVVSRGAGVASRLPALPPTLAGATRPAAKGPPIVIERKTPAGAIVQLQAYAGQVNATFKRLTAAQQAQLRALEVTANARIAQVHGDQLSALLTRSAIALAIMALASIGLGWLMAGRALRPVRTMATRARGISERNLHERLALEGPEDELKELAETFDGLLGRLEAAFESQRRFVANASHELRTPITLERTLVEVALADPDATIDSLRATCRRVLAASERQEQLIEALLTLARSQRGLASRAPVDLHEITREVVRAVPADGLRVDTQLDRARTTGDPAMVERLVANLVENAVRHNRPAGWVAARTGVREGMATIEVSNTGPQVGAAQVEELVKPFYRASQNGDGGGVGLGLSIVEAIVEAHGAALSAEARPEGGLRVTVAFPLDGGASIDR